MRTDPRFRILVNDQDQFDGQPSRTTRCLIAHATNCALREATADWRAHVYSDHIDAFQHAPCGACLTHFIGQLALPEDVVERIRAYDFEDAPLLGVGLELEAKLKGLHRRIGQALKAERDRGNKDRILISHEGKVYSIERPGEAIVPGKSWHFHFRPEGKLL